MPQTTFPMKLLCDTPEKEAIVFRQTVLPKRLSEILEALKKEPQAHIFLNRVSKKDAPNYYDVIKEPMDLSTVGKKLHLYRGLADFQYDLDLIWNNCLNYNAAEYFINCAREMRDIAESLIKQHGRAEPQTPEDVIYEGIPVIRGKERLKQSVARCLSVAGFKKVEGDIINIVSDILEYKICQEAKKFKLLDDS